jgi:uncharacterized membrane protein YciS (DUF1049 family)
MVSFFEVSTLLAEWIIVILLFIEVKMAYNKQKRKTIAQPNQQADRIVYY